MLWRAICISLFLSLLSVSCAKTTEDELSARPNFLLIISDDQRYDTMGEFMPQTQARIFDEGVQFTNAFITTPICCPSRASILTGMYAHTHGVLQNLLPLEERTMIDDLNDSGYFTGMVGKYLNSWPGAARPEFDYWAATPGGEMEYFNPRLNVNGANVTVEGYNTKILEEHALTFLAEAFQQEDPFMLIFAPIAPHSPATPFFGLNDLYDDLPPHRPPSFDEADRSDKPQWLQAIAPLDVEKVDRLRLNQLRTLWTLDKTVSAVLDALEDNHELENTVIFYISDNGVFWGEHGLRTKVWAYEEGIHVPFALRYPKLIPKGTIEDNLVANIDIAPTIYDLAGLEIPPRVDGQSLVPLLQGSGQWRTELLIEATPLADGVPYAAVRTLDYLYVENEGDRPELYEFATDPFQLENRADDPVLAGVLTDLAQKLAALLGPPAGGQDDPGSIPDS